MENIIRKIKQIYPVSDEALQALQANMELRYYLKDTRIVQSGVTDRLVYFIEEGITRSVFHHNGEDTTTWLKNGPFTLGVLEFLVALVGFFPGFEVHCMP